MKKNTNRILLISSIPFLLCIQCELLDTLNPLGPESGKGSGTMDASIDGVSWQSTQVECNWDKIITNTLTITGIKTLSNDMSDTIMLLVTSPHAGLNDSCDLSNARLYNQASNSMRFWWFGTGAINLSTLTDATASGTFTFKADTSSNFSSGKIITITGSFDVTF